MGNVKEWARWILFFSSYAPLYLVVALRGHEAKFSTFGIEFGLHELGGVEVSALSIGAILFTIFSVGFLLLVLHLKRSRGGVREDVENYENQTEMVTEYLIVYIFPFIVFDYTDPFNIGAFLILFLAIGAVQVRSNKLYANPVLAFFRYNIYKVEDDNGKRLILTKQTLKDEIVSLKTVELSTGVYVTVK
ncbi:hypothetical protein [Natronosalvus caseinilyticus]|uniref:hypothetical protein n=1 Tax=Natronosalvus caseinilyticus TaxID=2953747 RepID=UPI0028ABE718|nr:hypothetical protein [Natronosalvus caseinilyticus]